MPSFFNSSTWCQVPALCSVAHLAIGRGQNAQASPSVSNLRAARLSPLDLAADPHTHIEADLVKHIHSGQWYWVEALQGKAVKLLSEWTVSSRCWLSVLPIANYNFQIRASDPQVGNGRRLTHVL
ncbi:hypothetical protein BDK51DRAFT_27050 [Blyttiomyces helicus]|uniref:Uncharacterized protein n=1 Tax=Blyttiomyces helicus TaxID=388810 RepID=A0A4P9W3D0_9FUNG|nr:hypothetical protein BDK51DRAFT_27050 [Blyttiomyces helicus]|eukprot:RKO86821.1 hypothetical protein BDK51DRAFT_27050 [Blyttiomyces helicus]